MNTISATRVLRRLTKVIGKNYSNIKMYVIIQCYHYESATPKMSETSYCYTGATATKVLRAHIKCRCFSMILQLSWTMIMEFTIQLHPHVSRAEACLKCAASNKLQLSKVTAIVPCRLHNSTVKRFLAKTGLPPCQIPVNIRA